MLISSCDETLQFIVCVFYLLFILLGHRLLLMVCVEAGGTGSAGEVCVCSE